MDADARFRVDRGEPLGAWTHPLAPPAGEERGPRALRLEFSSRGDRVPGRLLLPPDGHGPFPLALLQRGADASGDAAHLDAGAASWARRGAAVLSIDFPLHGERADAKLARRMVRGLDPQADAGADEIRPLVVEFVRQAVIDLRRALDAAAQMPEIDGRRVVYVGLGLGTLVGAAFCAVDPRPRAAALALGGVGAGPPETDPARYLGRFAPRPLLFVSAAPEPMTSRAADEALFDAAGEPKQMVRLGAAAEPWSKAALEAIWPFLRRHLALEEP